MFVCFFVSSHQKQKTKKIFFIKKLLLIIVNSTMQSMQDNQLEQLPPPDSYQIYTTQWDDIGRKIKKNYYKNFKEGETPKFSVLHILYYHCNYRKQKFFIYKGKEVNVNSSFDSIKEYFDKSRYHVIDELKNNKYDLLIEFGSGWGVNLYYYLSKYPSLLKDIKIISGEYTESGVEIQKFIKEKYYPKINMDIYQFDFNNSNSFFDNIPDDNNYQNVLITTFWAIEQVTQVENSFIDNLLRKFKSFKIFFLEPVGWQVSSESLMKEYRDKKRNYYNKNLYSLLLEYQAQNQIKINNIELDYFYPSVKNNVGTLIEVTRAT